MFVTRKTEPSVEPVILAEAKKHLRIEDDWAEDDAYITALISVARRTVEDHTGRTLIDTVFVFNFPFWQTCFELPRGNVSSVEKVEYRDEDAVLVELAADQYRLSPAGDGESYLVATGAFTAPELHEDIVNDRIQITAKAGYGADATKVPQPLKQAILYMIAHLYDMRAPVMAGATPTAVPFTVNALCGPYQIYRV